MIFKLCGPVFLLLPLPLPLQHPCSKRLLIYDAEKLAPLRAFSQFVYKNPPRRKFFVFKNGIESKYLGLKSISRARTWQPTKYGSPQFYT